MDRVRVTETYLTKNDTQTCMQAHKQLQYLNTWIMIQMDFSLGVQVRGVWLERSAQQTTICILSSTTVSVHDWTTEMIN